MQNGHRLIGVVMGGRTFRQRDEEMAAMLDQGFMELGSQPVARRGMRQQAMIAAAPPQPAPAPEGPAQTQGRAETMSSLVAAVSHQPTAMGDDDPPPTRAERWGIQLGAFRDQAAAERARPKTPRASG